MRKISTLLFFVVLFITATGQDRRSFEFEIGGEGGVTIDYLTARDPADHLRRHSTGLVSGIVGPKIRRYIDKKFFLEAAFLLKQNAFGFRFKQEPGTWATSGSKIFIIPLRAGYDWHISNKVRITLLAGIVPSFITLSSEGSGGYGNVIQAGNDMVYYDYRARDDDKEFYLIVQPGISASHLIKKRIKFLIGVNYYHGFSDVELRDVTYRINNGPVQNAVIANRGSFINYNAGLSYLFNLRKKAE